MASSIAVDTIGQSIETLLSQTFLSCTPDQQELMINALMIESLNRANQYILNAKEVHPHLAQMGTTAVIALVWQKKITVAHLGDSRAYLWDPQGLAPLTKDHSMVQEMIDSGSLTEEQARTSDVRNHITRALGVTPTVEPTVNRFNLTDNTLIMLCSDGLTEYLNNDELEYILSTHRPALECCYRFIDDANHLGGKDNISVGIIECTLTQMVEPPVHIPPQPEPSLDEEDITVRKER